MNRKWSIVGIMVLALCGAAMGDEDSMSFISQAMGNSDVILIRAGLGEPNGVAAWGLAVAHEPESEEVEQATSFGAWGMLSTDIPLLSPGTLGLWAGLTAQPFIDIDILYDFDHDKVAVWPGAGVRLAPTRTLSFVARAVYPLGDDDVLWALEPEELVGLFGLEITF